MPDWNKVEELHPEDQVSIYREYLERNPNDPGIWFDLGLAYKRLRNWRGCIDANRRAVEISGDEGDPAWWNMGIAATAVRDWPLARWAWRGFGLHDIAEGTDP